MRWPRTHITVDGKAQDAIAPLVISASRATDIPAFYGEWFSRSLQRGYCTTSNPFNGVQSLVSFENVRVVVFWTKNPAPFFPYLRQLDDRGIGYYFLHSLNDYAAEGIEPGLPPLPRRIETFMKLSESIGKEKVLWRFDPLLLANNLDVKTLCQRVENIGDTICNHTNRLIFSFIDIEKYKKVKRSISMVKLGIREFSTDEKHLCAAIMQHQADKWRGSNPCFSVRSCAQEIDLGRYNISRNSCIDPQLILELFAADKQICAFIKQLSGGIRHDKLKDKGQRKDCRCTWSKDIGRYNTCPHYCAYCYANSNLTTVNINFCNHKSTSATI